MVVLIRVTVSAADFVEEGQDLEEEDVSGDREGEPVLELLVDTEADLVRLEDFEEREDGLSIEDDGEVEGHKLMEGDMESVNDRIGRVDTVELYVSLEDTEEEDEKEVDTLVVRDVFGDTVVLIERVPDMLKELDVECDREDCEDLEGVLVKLRTREFDAKGELLDGTEGEESMEIVEEVLGVRVEEREERGDAELDKEVVKEGVLVTVEVWVGEVDTESKESRDLDEEPETDGEGE